MNIITVRSAKEYDMMKKMNKVMSKPVVKKSVKVMPKSKVCPTCGGSGKC